MWTILIGTMFVIVHVLNFNETRILPINNLGVNLYTKAGVMKESLNPENGLPCVWPVAQN